MTFIAILLYSLISKFMSSPDAESCAASCVVAVDSNETSALTRARALDAPVPKSSVGGEYEDLEWWETHRDLLSDARKEWGQKHPELYKVDSAEFEERFIDPDFRTAFQNVIASPTPEIEATVRSLCFETNAPGVYAFRLFTKEFIDMLLEELDYQQESGIPVRRPNGMNRYGSILSELRLGPLMDHLVDRYFRSLGMLLFPLSVGPQDTKENYSFVVRYKQGQDVELAEHADASTVTVNICLGNKFEGGSLYFKGVRFSETADQEEQNEIEMDPGMGIIHLGGHVHAAKPLTGGERVNMIVWMFGQHGYVRVAPYTEKEAAEFEDKRWRPLDEL